MIEGQGNREHGLARFEMQQRVVVREQAVGGGAEGRVRQSQGRVGSITRGRVGTGVLKGCQSSRRGESGCGRQGTSQIQLCCRGAGTCMEQIKLHKQLNQCAELNKHTNDRIKRFFYQLAKTEV